MKLSDMNEGQKSHIMQTLAQAIDALCVEIGLEKALFALILFSEDDDTQYVSNCKRETMAAALREAAGKIESFRDKVRCDPYGQK